MVIFGNFWYNTLPTSYYRNLFFNHLPGVLLRRIPCHYWASAPLKNLGAAGEDGMCNYGDYFTVIISYICLSVSVIVNPNLAVCLFTGVSANHN